MPLPPARLFPKSAAETLESRIARGDYAAIAATLKGLATSLSALSGSIASLPDVPFGTPEGAALVGVKTNVVPELEKLVALTQSLTKAL